MHNTGPAGSRAEETKGTKGRSVGVAQPKSYTDGFSERNKFPETEDWLSVHADFAELFTCASIASGRSLTAGARLIHRPPCLQALTRLRVLLNACELLSCCKYCTTCTPLILSKLMQSFCCRSSRPKLSSLRIRTLSRHDING